MRKISWNDKLKIGVDVVDKAHARLFKIVGKLMEQMEYEPNYQNTCKESIRFLEDYTMGHFSEEEAYMRSIGYSGYEKHKRIHDKFRDVTLVSLKKRLEESDYAPEDVEHFSAVMAGWLTGHIMTEDQAIIGNIVAKRVYEDSLDTHIIANAFNQAMKDVFHLEAELVSGDYNGRNIRDCYYYHLCYDIKGGGNIQILLGLEEQLARRGVGMMLGLSAMQKPEMVGDASMKILEHFLHHLGKLFMSDSEYHLYKEERLTRDEFRKDFMTRCSCHLLFETRLGHFIFCVETW